MFRQETNDSGKLGVWQPMYRDSDYTFTRYLSAKKTVDDRALNRRVWDRLKQELSSFYSGNRIKILEIGAGIGTMLERSLEWDLFGCSEYTALDAMPENISEAQSRVPAWASCLSYSIDDLGRNRFRLRHSHRDIMVRLETADIFEFMDSDLSDSPWDLLIANAFLDLVDVPSTLPKLLALLKPGGLFYFTINFDGGTIFQPDIDPQMDTHIEALYHRTMDCRIVAGKSSGDSRTGRHFFEHVRCSRAELLDAGSSDWVVFAGPDGYPADEAFFLHFIVHTVGSALTGHPDLDSKRLAEWIRYRHAQIDNGTLVYIAHQMDFLGRYKGVART